LEYDPIKKTGFPNVSNADTRVLFMNPQFWGEIPVYEGLCPLLRQLSQEYEIHVVTARYWYKGIKETTEKWLDKNGIIYENLVCLPSKEKFQYINKNNIQYMIEDYPVVAESVSPFVEKVFLVERPWNDDCLMPDNCIRTNWNNIFQYLMENIETKLYICVKE
jgi:uncharacterized HAD superfamily protein